MPPQALSRKDKLVAQDDTTYYVVKKLGEGQFAEVYEVQDKDRNSVRGRGSRAWGRVPRGLDRVPL